MYTRIKKAKDLTAFNHLLTKNSEELKDIRIWEVYGEAFVFLKSDPIFQIFWRVAPTLLAISGYVKGKGIIHLPEALQLIEKIKLNAEGDEVKDLCSRCQAGMIKEFLSSEKDADAIRKTRDFTFQWFEQEKLRIEDIHNLFVKAEAENA